MILEAIEGYIYTNKDRTLWGKVIALDAGDLALNYELKRFNIIFVILNKKFFAIRKNFCYNIYSK